MSSCRLSQCAKEHAIYKEQQSKLIKNMIELDNLKDLGKISKKEHEEQLSKLGNSAAERKGMRDDLECSLRNCFDDYKKAITSMLKNVDKICKSEKNKEGCEKVKSIKVSLKKGLITVDEYAWLFKFLNNIELKV